jgi:hypothetical protein
MAKSIPDGDAMMKGKGKGDAFGKGVNGAGSPGWSCKVIVFAEKLHPDFPIVAKIVGANSQNMDHIRGQANCTVELRGQRSGTLDQRTGQELPEPMFVWIASDVPDYGMAALEMVKDLLGSVYDEHTQWCATHNLQWSETLTPQVIENSHLQEGPAPGQPPPSQGPPMDQGQPSAGSIRARPTACW